MESLERLRRLVAPPVPKAEKCELCGAPIADVHGHVVDIDQRRLLCACRPCYLLFTNSGAAQGKLRSVSERYLKLARVDIPEIPVGIVFFIRDQSGRVKAFYPSPLGATESNVSEPSWKEMLASAPELSALEPDIEALLVTKNDTWIVPVDACYRLIGRIKKSWRGFDGGRDAWREIDAFIAELPQMETRCA